MDITLNQEEVITAVKNYAAELAPGLDVQDVTFVNGRGEKGITAELVIGITGRSAKLASVPTMNNEAIIDEKDTTSSDELSPAQTVSQALELD